MSEKEIVIETGPATRLRVRPAYWRTSRPMPTGHARTVVVDCSDGRFTWANREFLQEALGEPFADEITVPGGVGAFHPLTSTSSFMVSELRLALSFLVDARETQRVVLLAHEDCERYTDKYPGRSEEELIRQQLTDLASMIRSLRGILPSDVEIRAFHKRIDGESIAFDEVLVE